MECDRIFSTFVLLEYQEGAVKSIVTNFLKEIALGGVCDVPIQNNNPLRRRADDSINIVKNDKSAGAVRRQLLDLSTKVGRLLRPVFVSQKLKTSLGIREKEPASLSQQCVVYKFRCYQCEAGYVGFTTRHLYQRIEEQYVKYVRVMHGLDTDSICIRISQF